MEKNARIYRINNFSLANRDLLVAETLFHNANGYIGVRSAFEEGYPEGYRSVRGQYVNGFYDVVPMNQAERLCGLPEEKETLLNVADTQGIRLKVCGEEFGMFCGTVLESSRTLDMERGVTERRAVWRSPAGRELELTVRRMASFALPPLFTIEYAVKALNFGGKLELCSTHLGGVMNYANPDDPRVAGEAARLLFPGPAEFEDGCSVIVSRTSRSGLSVAAAVRNALSKPCEETHAVRGGSASQTLSAEIAPGETISLVKYAVFRDSIRCGDCRSAALRTMAQAVSVPLSEWYARQRAYLAEYWEDCAVHVRGDPKLDSAVAFSLYELLQSVGKDSRCGIAAKGLSGEGYEGHCFWDMEMYVEPFFLLTRPGIVRSLIEYRYGMLPAARRNARVLGHAKGALFPWRTITGRECSGYFPSGSAQYHIDGDVAYSVVQYYLMTGDLKFLADRGAEIVFETARLWLDTGNYAGGKFRINCVTGPDEYTCLVDNNYYTNALARYNLSWAVKIYGLLKKSGSLGPVADKIALEEDEIAEFRRAADVMYLPYDAALDINPQDDSFLSKKKWDFGATPPENHPLLLHYHPLCLYRHQVCKQADTVMAHFILEDAQKFSTMKHSFEYYEAITTHDSSLSACVFSIMASRLGMPEKAYAYFREAASTDLNDTHGNTQDGIHTAGLGGTYMTVVYGFAGLRIREDGLHLSPALPSEWEGYDFRLRRGESRVLVSVGRRGCRVRLLSGPPAELFLYGKKVLLRDERCVPLPAAGAEKRE